MTKEQKEKLIVLPAENMQPWGKPKTLPPGAYDYLLIGNPGKPESYTFRFQLPANYQILPFSLTALCYMTVVSGQLYMGEGDVFNKSNKQVMSAGSFAVIPANTPLYFWTREETVLQFHGIGPVDVAYVNPSDDPRSVGKLS